jgi:hypothetical protein
MPSLVFFALAICLGISLVPVVLLRRKTYARAQDYFVSSGHTPPGVIQNSSIAYVLKISMFGPLIAWGASGDVWPAIISAAFLGLGLYLIYLVRRPLLAFFGDALSRDRSVTISEFVSERHGNDARVRLLASGLTVFALTGLIICETVGVANILKPLLAGNAALLYICVATVLASVILCTVVSGNSGAMYSAQLQLGLLYFGLLGSTVVLLYLEVSALKSMPPDAVLGIAFAAVFCVLLPISRRSRYVDNNVITDTGADGTARPHFGARMLRGFQRTLNITISVFASLIIVIAAMESYFEGITAIAHDSAVALLAPTRTPGVGLLALALLPLFYQTVDMTNWQRIAAFAKDREEGRDEQSAWSVAFRRFLKVYATETPMAWLFICSLGAILALSAAEPNGMDLVQAFIEQLISQQNSVASAALWLLLIGVLAMALSTMIALFSASLCTVRYDIAPIFSQASGRREGGASVEANATRLATAAGGALCVMVLAASFFFAGYLEITLTSSRFLALVFGFSCAQLAFAPLVLGPLIGRTEQGFGTVTPGWALGILAAGAAMGVGPVIVYLATGWETWLWAAIPACLGTGVVLFAIARVSAAKAA